MKYTLLCLILVLTLRQAKSNCFDDSLEGILYLLDKPTPTLYCESLCFINAGEMARMLKMNFPKLNPKKMNILVVKDKASSLFSNNERTKPIFGMATHNGTSAWAYHAFLEYEGFIIDLDFNKKMIYPMGMYFREMFPEVFVDGLKFNRLNDLEIKSIPAQEYLSTNKTRPEDLTFENVKFHEGHDFLPLAKYMFEKRGQQKTGP